MTALALTMLRMSAILVLAFALLPLLRRRSAALRSWVIAAALGCAACVPVLQLVVPSWGTTLDASTALAPGDAFFSPLLALWAAGAAINLLVLVAGMVRLMGIASAADPIREGRSADLALELGAAYRVHAPVLLLEADRPTLPVTWGHSQPKILLPPAARHWSDERARVVLAHELAHVSRRDWPIQVIATVIRSIYWFNPLVWLACARLRFESERACDDVVLAGGVSGRRYASHLLELARGFVGRQPEAIAASLAGRSTLERRVRAMLTIGADRSPLRASRGAVVAALMFVATTAIAGFGGAVEIAAPEPTAPPRRLTLLLDGRIMDLSKEWPTYPNPRAGVVKGPGLPPGPRFP